MASCPWEGMGTILTLPQRRADGWRNLHFIPDKGPDFIPIASNSIYRIYYAGVLAVYVENGERKRIQARTSIIKGGMG